MPLILILSGLSIIIGFVVNRVSKSNKRELVIEVEDKISDFINKLVNYSSEISATAGGATALSFPTNPKEALSQCYDYYPELVYGMYVFLLMFYYEIDPDGEDIVGKDLEENLNSVFHVSPMDDESIIDFILERAG